jgi:polar amino acid transport system substrate-binding protein
VDTIANAVPAAFKTKGTLIVASDATYAPQESIGTDGKTVVGMDPDLITALATVMGLKVDIQNIGFDSILPGIAAGKYDVGMSSFTDTKKREGTVDFVTYFSSGTAFVVKTNGPTINSLADMCGHSASVEIGTTQADDLAKQDTDCKAAGKAGVAVSVLKNQNEVVLALQSDRVEVFLADYPVAVYSVSQSSGKFKVTGTPYNTAPYGIALPKGSGMAAVTLDALKELMKNGVYQSILQKWGVDKGAINNPAINQGS